jgi:hypothetical protein
MTLPNFSLPPEPPSRQSPATFSARADGFVKYLISFAREIRAAVPWFAAMVAKSNNIAEANEWKKDTQYAVGKTVWSPKDLQVYRAFRDHLSTTDPVDDNVNWVLVGGFPASHIVDRDNPHGVTAAQIGAFHPGNQGAGSGMDADKLDGKHGSYYADITARLGFTPLQQGGGSGQGDSKVRIGWGVAGNLHLHVNDTNFADTWPIHIGGNAASATNATNAGYAAHAGNADTVDGYHAASLAKINGSSIEGGDWFKSASGGWLRMQNSHLTEFHWNGGFYYRVDGNAWVLINSSASDERFKLIQPAKDRPFDFVKAVSPIFYEPDPDAPVGMPPGLRHGFSAQNLRQVDASLVEEKPVPFAPEHERDDDGELILDEDGAPKALPHELEGQTYLALAPDAQYQMLAKLWRAVRELIERSEKNDGAGPEIDETKEETLEEIRESALKFVHDLHARTITRATGNVTIADRDT